MPGWTVMAGSLDWVAAFPDAVDSAGPWLGSVGRWSMVIEAAPYS
jgi:hypothetical protein